MISGSEAQKTPMGEHCSGLIEQTDTKADERGKGVAGEEPPRAQPDVS